MTKRVASLGLLLVVTGVMAAPVHAIAPLDVRIIAGSMPGTPGRTEKFPAHRLSTSDRTYYNAQFRSVKLREHAADAIAFMGRIHKIVHYSTGPFGCDYFDGGFVICIWNGRVAAKGYQTP